MVESGDMVFHGTTYVVTLGVLGGEVRHMLRQSHCATIAEVILQFLD